MALLLLNVLSSPNKCFLRDYDDYDDDNDDNVDTVEDDEDDNDNGNDNDVANDVNVCDAQWS